MTDKLLEIMEQGEIPWKKSWQGIYQGGPPMSWSSKKVYRGCNFMLLRCAPYSCNKWVTYKQAKAMGGNVRRGEKSWPCVFWKFLDKKDDKGKIVLDRRGNPENIPMLKSYSVFNLEQCDGIEIPKAESFELLDFTPIARCEVTVAAMPEKPTIKHRGSRACFCSATDELDMPEKETFASEEEYYGTLFHELVHSTGHEKRLKRPLAVCRTWFQKSS